jgi:hypothetical protein
VGGFEDGVAGDVVDVAAGGDADAADLRGRAGSRRREGEHGSDQPSRSDCCHAVRNYLWQPGRRQPGSFRRAPLVAAKTTSRRLSLPVQPSAPSRCAAAFILRSSGLVNAGDVTVVTLVAIRAAGRCAVWEYKAICRLGDDPAGQWSDIATISVMGT